MYQQSAKPCTLNCQPLLLIKSTTDIVGTTKEYIAGKLLTSSMLCLIVILSSKNSLHETHNKTKNISLDGLYAVLGYAVDRRVH